MINFKMHVCLSQKEENGMIVNILPSTQNNFDQSGLGPGQEYEVSLRVVKGNGTGPQATRTVTTSEFVTVHPRLHALWLSL